MNLQKLWSADSKKANPKKLADVGVITAFLELVAGKLLKIENPSAYILGVSPNPDDIKGEAFFVGGIVSEPASVFVSTVPDRRTVEVKILVDDWVHPDIQMKTILVLKETFEGD